MIMNGTTEGVFRFLITTDNHLGYKHTDHIRGEDSFLAFAEALKIARSKDVDFILLGGDLFHTNRPSAMVEHRCIQIIREHMATECSRLTSFRRIEGQFCHFERVSHPNFEDPHLTVPHPIFTIHGNHDDQTGPQNQSVCAKLATSGLLNYFGLATSSDDKILVEPIILQKGAIKIAIYGMGFMSDHKLKVAFDKGKVCFKPPPEDSFNILVVHQNRVPFVEGKYISDNTYPNFIHLLIRGHEHNAQAPEPLLNSEVNGLVYQPGSTVATSISTFEAVSKKVGVFQVRIANPKGDPANRFKLDHELVELKSCRKMLCKDITQKEVINYIKKNSAAKALKPADYIVFAKAYVDECIKNILQEHNPKSLIEEGPQAAKKLKSTQEPCLPLVRVRLEIVNKLEKFDELEVSNQLYPNLVANRDILLFKKQKLKKTDEGVEENVTFTEITQDSAEFDDLVDFVDLSTEKKDTIESALESFFNNKPESERLQVLSISEYINAIRGSCEEGNVISKVVKAKKQDVLIRYRAVLKDEETAKYKFHSPESVERWLMSAFAGINDKMAGDSMDYVTID